MLRRGIVWSRALRVVCCAGALCGEVAGNAVPYPARVGAPLGWCPRDRGVMVETYMTRALHSAWDRNARGPWRPPRANTRGVA